MDKKKRDKAKNTLSSTQEVLYQREFQKARSCSRISARKAFKVKMNN